jgi:outer membrane protein assembly factor BamE (lipoprotein component of BamABCDE complex)
MTLRQGRTAALALILGTGLLAGCAQVRDRQGYLMDEEIVSSVTVGVDNKESVANTLGRPTFVGQFGDNDWYYVSRQTRNMGYQTPRVIDQTVLHVKFDPAGNVASVNRTGVDQVASIEPTGKKTPTLGQERGFFEELFGNIGTVGASGQQAPTNDNPR